jgi:CRP-like cAMP-binding protein
LENLITFFRSFEFFRKTPKQNLLDLILHEFKEVHAPKGLVFYKEGDQANKIFLIMEGEVEVLVKQKKLFGK